MLQDKKEEENFNFKDLILINPLFIPSNKMTEQYFNIALPFDVGIEIETEIFKSSFDIMQNFNKSIVIQNDTEIKIRISKGLEGAKVLYNFLKLLNKHAYFNNLSGIHYHIDFTTFFDFFNNDINKIEKIICQHETYILTELDKWNYKGTFNTRRISSNKGDWLSIRKMFKTLEFRIGEMSFDYSLIIKRILHLTEIVKFLYTANVFSFEIANIEEDNKIIKNRIIKI